MIHQRYPSYTWLIHLFAMKITNFPILVKHIWTVLS